MSDKYDVRPKNSYPDEVVKQIELLAFNVDDDDNTIQPVGSFAYRIQKYPSDIDLMESYVVEGGEQKLIKKFIRDLQRVTKDILAHEPDNFFLEFKAGLDERYRLKGGVGKLSNGVFHKNPALIPWAEGMATGGLLDEEELEVIEESDDYEQLNEVLRQRRTVRWSAQDVLKGYKMLPGGVKMTLEDALEAKSVVKLDEAAWIDGKYKEVTNFLLIGREDPKTGKLIPLNLEYDFSDRRAFVEKIKREIPPETEKLLYNEDEFSPFKAIKRMFSLARQIQDKEMMDILAPIIDSNVSLLYQIKGDIGTLEVLRDRGYFSKDYKYHKIMRQRLREEIGDMKERLSGAIELTTDTIERLNELLDQGKFSKVSDYLGSVIDKRSVAFLKKNNLLVPPSPYLPAKVTYKRILPRLN